MCFRDGFALWKTTRMAAFWCSCKHSCLTLRKLGFKYEPIPFCVEFAWSPHGCVAICTLASPQSRKTYMWGHLVTCYKSSQDEVGKDNWIDIKKEHFQLKLLLNWLDNLVSMQIKFCLKFTLWGQVSVNMLNTIPLIRAIRKEFHQNMLTFLFKKKHLLSTWCYYKCFYCPLKCGLWSESF